jgi:hypothetical protein
MIPRLTGCSPVLARMGSATTSQQFIRQIGAALGISAFVLAATVGGFRLGLLLMIAVSAGTFACVLALPAHSLHDAHHVDSERRKRAIASRLKFPPYS